jgi:3',5'-cyclic AMP phosphodiesterase CpdA
MPSTIRILHLSDLHFGDFNRFAGRDPRRLGQSFHKSLVEARKQLADEGGIDLVVVSGDVAERGKPTEFEAGRAFLEALADGLGLLPERFVFVPGNHDISWPECKMVEAEQERDDFDDAERERRTAAVKLKHYDAFVRAFYGDRGPAELGASPLGQGSWLFSFSDLGLSVAALSSCGKESHKVHGGFLGEEPAQNLMNAWSDSAARDAIKMVVIHHNPDLTTSNNREWWKEKLKKEGLAAAETVVDAYFSDVCGLEGAELLKRIVAEGQAQLVMHGHQHAGDEKSWSWRAPGQGYVLSAGSLGLSEKHLPKNEPLSCRLIRLEVGADPPMLVAHRLVYTAWAKTHGDLQEGAFTLDPAQPHGWRQRLELPGVAVASHGEAASGPAVAAPKPQELAAFLRIFRQRLSGAYSSWAFSGVAQNAASGRPLEGRLDDMYVELRFHPEIDPNKVDRGQPLRLKFLRERKNPLLIRGAAGCGKTTWMRRTFRRLLADEGFVPLMLVLRDLSRAWQDPASKGEKRSLDVFLEEWLGEQMGPGWAGKAGELLRLKEGPRPVLLVDGWDELGELGEEVRGKLAGLMREQPRLLVIVSSRPYGKDKPSHAEGFEELEVQPLADGDREELSRRFFRLCNPADQTAAEREAAAFAKAFATSEEAGRLARTPLFLTMMLMIGRAKPLPDKRHLLYQDCVDNLLQALPEKRRREGARELDAHWRPADSEERWRVVARLAFEMQSESYGKGRGAIVRSGEELERLLPTKWKPAEKRGFLAWLAGPAGLLSDRTDGSFQLTHLSFQEFLAAWHLDATCEGVARVEMFAALAAQADWWETLQLWAALVDRRNPDQLGEVLAGLRRIPSGLALAGMVLADGSGPDAAFMEWLVAFTAALAVGWPEQGDRCLSAWKSSNQYNRKRGLADCLRQEDWGFAPWQRVALFCRVVKQEEPRLPTQLAVSQAALQQMRGPQPDGWKAGHFAASRLFTGRHPLWPPAPDLAGLLHSWPNRRRWLGARLQALAVACPQVDILRIGRDQFESGSRPDQQIEESASEVARYFARYFASDFERFSVSDYFARDFARYFARYFMRDYFTRDLARELVRLLGRNFVGDFARYVVRDLTREFGREFVRSLRRNFAYYLKHNFSRFFAIDFARKIARELEGCFRNDFPAGPESPGLRDWAVLEALSAGRCGARFALALLDPEEQSGIVRLYCLAARLSYRPRSDSQPFQQVLTEIGPDLPPLWPALAKHLCRRSTTEDRALLLDLAKNPEKAGEPLCWGLQFIVRGDVMREDGSIVTLDQIAAVAEQEPLPLLDDMPPELVT